MRNEVIVQEESLQKAIDFFNTLNTDKKYNNEIKKLFNEQPYIITYIMAVNDSEGLNDQVLQEVIELVYICWLSFNFEGVKMPEIKEEIIDFVISETENISNEIINALGFDPDDENILEKMNAINAVIGNADFQNPDKLIEFIKSNNLEGLMDTIIKGEKRNEQIVLLDYCTQELHDSQYSFKTEEIAIMHGLINSVVQCFDITANKKPVMKLVKTPDKKRRVSKRKTKKNCYQVKVTLKGIRPPIWRRLLISDEITLDELNEILIDTMGWEGYHLYDFDIDGLNYAVPDGDFEMQDVDSREAYLSDLYLEEGSKFIYRYDFGDDWEHTVLIEKILPYDKNQKYPFCIKGKRNCPPEDVGGVWRYQDMLQIIQDKENKEYNEWIDWLGDDFDPEEFNMEEINCRLI